MRRFCHISVLLDARYSPFALLCWCLEHAEITPFWQCHVHFESMDVLVDFKRVCSSSSLPCVPCVTSGSRAGQGLRSGVCTRALGSSVPVTILPLKVCCPSSTVQPCHLVLPQLQLVPYPCWLRSRSGIRSCCSSTSATMSSWNHSSFERFLPVHFNLVGEGHSQICAIR